MGSASYELSADGTPAVDAAATALRWPLTPGSTDTVTSDLGWRLTELGPVPGAAIDLARLAVGAYLADRLTPRGTGFSRNLSLSVAVTDPDLWQTGPADALRRLLAWLTGDVWNLTVVPDTAPDAELITAAPDSSPTSLLSGGLDSFLGAIHLLDAEPSLRFLGHNDAATSIRASQALVGKWIADTYAPAPSYTRLAVRQAGAQQEKSSRSRSLLFSALGTAATAACGGQTLHVPENGYTSLNVPLHANRAGALSTRSTHPETFRRLNELLDSLSIAVAIANPFQAITKGEAMKLVADGSPPSGWLDIASGTLSCSKLDGNWHHGNPNMNCGLCVSCAVRRGTFIAAGQNDTTSYVVDQLAGADRDALVWHRRHDIEAIRYAVSAGVDDDLIDGGTWPPDQDLDATADLVQRGLDELAAVPLP